MPTVTMLKTVKYKSVSRLPICSSHHAAMHPAQLNSNELLAECRITRTRRSGPGGQHRNKVESAVVIEHSNSGVIAEANERRSQHENRAVAVFRLRMNLAIAIRTAQPSVASQLWQRRVRGTRISVSPSHEDFPALLAEALDAIAANDFDLKSAAAHFEVTPSQLGRFLKLEPRAFQWLNRSREQRGLKRLR